MSTYQQIVVATQANVGARGPLPAFLVGLSDTTLADLSAHLDPTSMESPHLAPLAGMGFTRVSDPPSNPRWVSPYTFLQRFTPAERQAIEASTDKVVVDFLTLLHAIPPGSDGVSTGVYLDDPQTQGAVAYMASSGVALIGAGRPAQILA